MYEKHFHEDAMSRRLQRVNPIPTKRGPHCGKRQLNERTLNYGENPLRLEIWSQISCLISSLKTTFHRMRKLKESIVHPPFKSVKPKISNGLQDYKSVFYVRKFPVISQAINIDKDMRVKLQINGIPVPLLSCLLKGVTQMW